MDRMYEQCLGHVDRKCISDPHGLTMYRPIGEVRCGGRVLQIWATIRGDSQLEVCLRACVHRLQHAV
jgi:hypothetical protein